MLILQDISYAHPNKDVLFTDINLTVNKQEKIALIGNNGSGKSTLLKLLAQLITPSSGIFKNDFNTYYIPQITNQFNDCTVAQALQVDKKIAALHQILEGNVTDEHLKTLNDDWSVEEKCQAAFSHWGLENISLQQQMNTLSGGQKTKVFLSGITIQEPQLVLMDEPSNHLDVTSRTMLYDYIQTTNHTLVVVSHDRTLLNLLNTVYELSKHGISVYGGNYDFYLEQKTIKADARAEDLKHKEKSLRKAKETERATLERQQKLDARGKKKQEKAGLPTISMNTFRNNAEKSTSRIKDIHAGKVDAIAQEVNQLRKGMADKSKMKIGFEDADLHKGKILFQANAINFNYGQQALWKENLTFEIISGQRIAIKGTNGSGKTTLIKILLNQLQPTSGTLYRADTKSIYIDQDYSLIDSKQSVYEQAQLFNTENTPEHEVKSRLTHFLFTQSFWDKPCSQLSGGEKMRLILCCLTISNQAPDIIILDEPTNNLDIQNIEILTAAINDYQGTLLVISHDAYFLSEINANRTIDLK